MNKQASSSLWFPLTREQQHVWAAQQIDPPKSTYNVPLAFRLQGPVDEAAVEQAFRNLSSRHSILCTSIWEGGPTSLSGSEEKRQTLRFSACSSCRLGRSN
ncbi:condensation domain-containing protein [Kitasatospora cineracea]